MSDSFVTDFKRFFFRGLAAFLPTVITLIILIYIFNFVDDYVGRYVNLSVQWIVVQFTCVIRRLPISLKGAEDAWKTVEAFWDAYYFNWLGFFLGFVAIYFFGRFVASWLGRGLWRMLERTFFRIPVVRQIYPHVKQVTDFLFSDRTRDFSRVVAVEYPRKDIWSIGLVTGPGMRSIRKTVGADLLTIFIPSSPTPVTGYTITVKRDEVIDLPLTIDEAFRFTVSGGVILPDNETPLPEGGGTAQAILDVVKRQDKKS